MKYLKIHKNNKIKIELPGAVRGTVVVFELVLGIDCGPLDSR